MKSLAIMQPYFFPYIGYFQLINAVDKFVFYDDVNFIKQGWINRNRILTHKGSIFFSVPLKRVSSYVKIKDTLIDKNQYKVWQNKFLKTLIHNYQKSPYFEVVYEGIKSVLTKKNYSTINELCIESILWTSKYLSILTDIAGSSSIYQNEDLKGNHRILDIIKQENAKVYVNLIGGMQLYNKEEFKLFGVNLYFISSHEIKYKQLGREFVDSLSIIDVLMFNSPQNINDMLESYTLN